MKHLYLVLLKNINSTNLKSVNAKFFSQLMFISLCFLSSHYSYAMKINWTDKVQSTITQKIHKFNPNSRITSLIKDVNLTLSNVTPTATNLNGLEKMIAEVYKLKLSISDAQRDEFIAHTFTNRVMAIKEKLGISAQTSQPTKSNAPNGDKKLTVQTPSKPDKVHPSVPPHNYTKPESSVGDNHTNSSEAAALPLSVTKTPYSTTPLHKPSKPEQVHPSVPPHSYTKPESSVGDNHTNSSKAAGLPLKVTRVPPVLSDSVRRKVKKLYNETSESHEIYPHGLPSGVIPPSHMPKPNPYPTYIRGKQQHPM